MVARWLVAMVAVASFGLAEGPAVPAGDRGPLLGAAELPLGVSGVHPRPEDFRGMRRVGVKVYRMVFSQRVVQKPNGRFDWSSVDRQVALAAQHGITVLPILYRADGAIPDPPRTDSALAKWNSFVKTAVARYGKGGRFWSIRNLLVPRRPITAWQVWNEPNLRFFWPDPSPAAYTKLLRRTAGLIRAVDPRSRVVLAGLNGLAPRPLRPQRFLRQLYARGAAPYFDVAAVHPYASGALGVRMKTGSVARVMDRRGDGQTPLWVTEVGWSTATDVSHELVTDRGGQARKLTRTVWALRRLARWRPIELVVWFSWRDHRTFGCDWCIGTGLLERDGTAKPALSRFQLAGL